MRNILKEYAEIFEKIKSNIFVLFKFQILAKLMVFIVLIPILKYIPKLLMRSKGYEYLTNGVITKFLFSFQGVISITWIILISMMILLIEIGGLIVVSYGIHTGEEEIKFRSILKLGLSKIQNFSGIGGILIVLYFIVIMPWLGIGIHTSLLEDVGVPGFIKAYIYDSPILNVLYILLLVICTVMVILGVFSLHIMIFEKKKAIEALKKSMKLVKENAKAFFIENIGVAFINIGILIVLVFIWSFMAVMLLSHVNMGSTSAYIGFSVVMFIGIIFVFIYALVALPFQIYQLTRQYFRFTGEVPKLEIEVKKTNGIIEKIFKRKRTLALSICIFFGAGCLLSGLIILGANDVKYEVKITAHRGASRTAPENTLAALEKAVELGAGYSEIDVQETKDGRIILLHDSNLKRTTGMDLNVWEANYNDIKELDNGSWFSEEFKDVRVPTLDEVLDYTKGKMKLNIEIKKNGHEKNLIKNVIDIIKEKKCMDSVVITSLDYEVIKEVEMLEPRLKTGYVMYVAIGNLDGLQSDFYSIEYANINDDFVTQAHRLGREVHVWTVNKTDEIENAISLGVDNIITDDVEAVKYTIKEMNEEDEIFGLLFK